jgi:uroporphyrinogen decarboxylase
MSESKGMTSSERIGTTLGHQEPDRVPFLLPTILQGARLLGLPIREYFSRAEYVVEGQLRLRQRYRHDALFGFMYASQELEAWGGETLFRGDGPPNGGAPVIRAPEEIERLAPPAVADSPILQRILAVIEQLRARVGDAVPIMGVSIAPFSLPVMQMGFEAYLDLMHDRPELLDRLLRINEAYCVEWSNAQLAAGATAISYTDPVCSPSSVISWSCRSRRSRLDSDT